MTIVKQLSGLPAWARWAAYAALGILVLSIVQSFDDTGQLTEAGSSQAMLRWAVPILLAGLGGLYAERSGVVNIGLEGMMVLGTWFGAWGSINYGPWAGVLIGALGGGLGGLLHAVATIQFGVDQIISGVAINLLAPGVTRFLASEIFTGYDGGSITKSPGVDSVSSVTAPLLAGGWDTPNFLGWLGDKDIFFVSDVASFAEGLLSDMSLMVVLSLALVPLTAWVLWRTRFGLRLRSAGERPEAGESQGINVYVYKYAGVVISGLLAGLAGAFIVSDELGGSYIENQTNGRGFIGLAALIFGNWRPAGVLGAALLFGYPFGVGLRDLSGAGSHSLLLVTAVALVGIALYSYLKGKIVDTGLAGAMAAGLVVWYFASDSVPDWWVEILPYVIVLVVLVFFAQRLRPPAAAGRPYRRGET